MTLAALAGCTADPFDAAPQRPYAEGSIVLRIGAGGRAQTRTRLEGSYNLHQVQQVYAILYKGEGSTATYVCHKNLNWSPKDSADYGEGVVQEKVYEFAVPPTLQSGSKCTLLCVGLDDQSGATYGLTLNDSQTPAFLADGKTLGDAQAILASGHSTKAAELFAGWDTLTYQRKDTTAVEVEMTRRVAGAYAYLKDIPVQVSGDSVKYIQWVLGNSPTTQIGLARVERTTDNTLPDDFGSGENTATDAKILDKLTLADIAKVNTTTGLYDIDTLYTKPLGLTKGTLLLSAYLLPMEKGTNGTLAVQLLNKAGTVIKSFPAQWNNLPTAAGTKTHYSIYPNYVYHAGTRSTDSDRPASLAGDRIELVVQEWEKVTINTDFPKVPLEATIDYDKNPSSYIYDCINTRDTLTIMPSLLQRKWTLTLVAEDQDGNEAPTGTCDWIYFEKSDGSYTQTLSSDDFTSGTSTASQVVIRLCDYVVKRDYDPSTTAGQTAINTDWRRARIVITTEDSSSPSHLSIRQYNAITVNVTFLKKTKDPCGFSRYNYGVERDGNGTITNGGDGYQGQWGIKDEVYGLIYSENGAESSDITGSQNYYDGHYAHENIRNAITSDTGYWGTNGDISSQPIIRYSWTESWVYKNNQREQDKLNWYLPSRNELYCFFNEFASQSAIDTNVKNNQLYWSSTAKYNSDKKNGSRLSYCQMLGDDGKPKKMNDSEVLRSREWRTTIGYARRARHFAGYTCIIGG